MVVTFWSASHGPLLVHWEGDLIIGKNGQTAAATLVERLTRFAAILALPFGKNSQGLADAVIAATAALPQMLAKSLVRMGAPPGTRTPNPLVKSQLLCQLS